MGVGLAGEERWRQAAGGGPLLGSRPGRYPYDFAAWVRYQRAIAELPRAGPRPSPLALDELDLFLSEPGEDPDAVSWR